MSRSRPTPYGTEESLALENARLREALRRERLRSAGLARTLEEQERRAAAALEDAERREKAAARAREDDLARILFAWEDAGPMPRVHRRAQREVRHTMPVLVRRIERAVRRGR